MDHPLGLPGHKQYLCIEREREREREREKKKSREERTQNGSPIAVVIPEPCLQHTMHPKSVCQRGENEGNHSSGR